MFIIIADHILFYNLSFSFSIIFLYFIMINSNILCNYLITFFITILHKHPIYFFHFRIFAVTMYFNY